MLNLMSVTSNEKVLAKQFGKFLDNPTFGEFVDLFMKIVDANLRENVMDFFDIVFEECGVTELNRGQLTDLLCDRMDCDQAYEIVDQIFYLMGHDRKTISTTDILTLCCTNDEFCMFMKQFSELDIKKK